MLPRLIRPLLIAALVLAAPMARAQDTTPEAQIDEQLFVRIVSAPNLAQAEALLREFTASGLDGLAGFQLNAGWYGLAIGPFVTEVAARNALAELSRRGRIPGDSFLAARNEMGPQFWPAGSALSVPLEDASPEATPATATPEPSAEADPAPNTAAPEPEPEQTPAERLAAARAFEQNMDRDTRREAQRLLQWAGFYNSTLDGLFGRGTRAAVSAWQTDRGLEANGVISQENFAQLEREYNAIFEGLGLEERHLVEAGIRMELPMAVLRQDEAQPPFITFRPTGTPEVTVIVISQSGGRDRLAGLYQAMQTLDLIPLEGARELRADRFTITGTDTDSTAHVEATTDGETIKGFALIWPTGDDERHARVLDRMRTSFTREDGVLGEATLAAWSGREALLAGLELRQPSATGSGVFVTRDGAILTHAALVGACERVTLGADLELRIEASDTAANLALLRSLESPLAPRNVLGLGQALSGPGEVAVAGYPFQGRLGQASITFGELKDNQGLDGQEGLLRLEIATTEGDAGGPVLTRAGDFIGLLLPTSTDGTRLLPDRVHFAATSDAVSEFLGANGITLAAEGPSAEDVIALRDYAQEITALIQCWE